MITLKKLDSLILKCCNVVKSDQNKDTDYYKFGINFDQLESMLSNVDKNLHPLVECAELESRPVEFKDIQNLTEYLHKADEFTPVFEKCEMVQFLIYCTQDKTGKNFEFFDDENNKINPYDAYKVDEGVEGEWGINKEILQQIVQNLPMYMVTVIRSFDHEHYKYDYKIYIRSNYEMVSYFKAMSAQNAADDEQGAEKKKNHKK